MARQLQRERVLPHPGGAALTSQDGERSEFGPGDSFVIPAGYAGTWETIEDCRKLYAIFEPQK